jgi:hypothetical protein
MAADWWEIYGPSQPEAEERRCWDCHNVVRRHAVGPDGVRCVGCWRARTEMGHNRCP